MHTYIHNIYITYIEHWIFFRFFPAEHSRPRIPLGTRGPAYKHKILLATDQEGAELQLLLDVGKCLLLRGWTFSL